MSFQFPDDKAIVAMGYRVRGPITAIDTLAFWDCAKVDPSGAGFILSLPSVSAQKGAPIAVKNVTNSTNPVLLTAQVGETIEGSATLPMCKGHQVIVLIADPDSNSWINLTKRENFSHKTIPTSCVVTIPKNQQMIVADEHTVDGTLIIEDDAELVVIDTGGLS